MEYEGFCYCSNCGKKTPYSTYTVPDLGGWKDGMRYTFSGKQARCSICTKMVFPEKIKEYNQKMLDEAARHALVH